MPEGGPPAEPISIQVRRFVPGDEPAIARLNARLEAGGSPHRLYHEREGERERGEDLPRERLYVAASGKEIHGGAYLREGRFRVGAEVIVVGWVKYPVAESLVDRAFASVPSALMFHLSRLQPNLIAAGLGGHTGGFAQLLTRLRWTGETVPGFVLPLNVQRIARALPHLQRRRSTRIAALVARLSGMGLVASVLAPMMASGRARRLAAGCEVRTEPVGGDWARDMWDSLADEYAVAAVRDPAWLSWQYPAGATGVTRLSVSRAGSPIGWVVTQVIDYRRRAEGSPYGPLVLGVLHDTLGRSTDAAALTAVAVRSMIDQGADLILGRQSHPTWAAAMRRHGFLPAPATFAFYRSPGVQKRLAALGSDSPYFVNDADHGVA